MRKHDRARISSFRLQLLFFLMAIAFTSTNVNKTRMSVGRICELSDKCTLQVRQRYSCRRHPFLSSLKDAEEHLASIIVSKIWISTRNFDNRLDFCHWFRLSANKTFTRDFALYNDGYLKEHPNVNRPIFLVKIIKNNIYYYKKFQRALECHVLNLII